MEWPSKFALSINGAVTAYSLSLSHSHPASNTTTTSTTTLFHARTLRHQFEGLSANVSYSGRLVALVGRHQWPYTLLNFTIASPALHTGLRLGQRVGGGVRVASSTGDLEDITVAVRLRWSTTPFIADGVREGDEDAGGDGDGDGDGDGGGGGTVKSDQSAIVSRPGMQNKW
ncbi:hypothetical protein Pmani_036889 [Petrolisthes manimaculis]|uniref:Uncharacterized protein n=1 Tax=Petrolisthes manimaculis TaxID=1843537 RepID=A0AAE1NHG9_9EUCA|nr:hypothetical protein Pmani_036889 [Petrolisthes manimaculis]